MVTASTGMRWGINMDNTYFYSAETNAFYVSSLISDYEQAGTLPDDISEISNQWYEYLISGQAMGKVITPDEDGRPVLSEPEPPTPQEIREIAEGEKSRLIREAGEAIAVLQDADELGMATEDELSALTRWKRYRVILNRLDISTAPDIEWPEKPD